MADTPKTWKQVLAPYALRLAIALAAAAIGALGTWLGVPPKQVETIREKLVEVPVLDEHGPAPPTARNATGWVRDDDAVLLVRNAQPNPVFANTPAGQAEAVPDRVYLWDYVKAALGGKHIPARDQGSVGSCVAFGGACAVDYQQCVIRVQSLKAGQPPPEFKAVSTEVLYGGMRVQIGKGQIRGDGGIGAWQAQFCNQFGSVARGKYDEYDLSVYSEAMCRKFGNTGCPAALVPEAKKHPTRSISQVKTVDEAKKALAALYPITVASDVGFGSRGPYVRNAKGQLRASGQWMHQMCLIGYDKDSGFYCMNSWGATWVSGPTGPGDPPPGGFYIEEATVARMLAQGDSWAYGDQVGFPARRLDWDIRAVPKRDPLDFVRRGEAVLVW